MTIDEIYDRIEALLEKINNNTYDQEYIINCEMQLDSQEHEREILEGSQHEYCQA